MRNLDNLTDQIEQTIDQSWTVDQEQTEQTDSQTGDSNQASNTSANNSSPLESETSQSSFLEDKVKKNLNVPIPWRCITCLVVLTGISFPKYLFAWREWQNLSNNNFCEN